MQRFGKKNIFSISVANATVFSGKLLYTVTIANYGNSLKLKAIIIQIQ